MKVSTIVIFIFSVIGLLALIAYTFPEEGLTIGNMQLKFPTLAEVMRTQPDTTPTDTVPEDTLTTEELMQMRMDALKAEKESEFLDYCRTNPARIYMPHDSIGYLDPLFDALETARRHPLRIMHYGDSQLEGDRITSVLREAFQERFGGNGVGLVPAIQTIGTYTLSQTAVPDGLPRHLVYGPADMRLTDKAYGPMGQTATIDGTATFSFTTRMRDTYRSASRFSRVTLLTKSPVEARITVAGDTLTMDESQNGAGIYFYTARLNTSRTTVTLTVEGQTDIYGILLDGANGVAVDNIPMRGCSGTIFTSISQTTLAPFYRRENVRFIILQYGGNSVPYLKNDKGIASYTAGLKRQIDYLRRLAPEARMLFIGPSDMSTSIDGQMQTYPMLPRIVEALKQMADECGIAYWDLYAVMGGRGSMLKWVDSQLAGPDYVHFTPKGARHVGNMLYETLEYYHKFYRFRTGKDRLRLSADSTELVIDSTGTTLPDSQPAADSTDSDRTKAATSADTTNRRHAEQTSRAATLATNPGDSPATDSAVPARDSAIHQK